MSFLSKLSTFANSANEALCKLEKKTDDLLVKSNEFNENQRLKSFDDVKDFLKESNKEREKLGMEQVSIFDFFKDRSDYKDLLDKEREKLFNK